MPQVTFEEVYANAYVRQSIQVIVRKTINAYPMLNQSESDIHQELLIALNGRLASFDPKRSSVEGFCRMALESDIRKIIRKYFSRQAIFERLAVHNNLSMEGSCDTYDNSVEVHELTMDVQSVILSLSREEQKVCHLLMAGYSFRHVAMALDTNLRTLQRTYILSICQRFIEFGFEKITKNFEKHESL